MSLADDIKSMYKHTNDVYDSLAAIGVTLPENKNLENLADTFASINIELPYDPENPTLEGIKAAMQAGDYSAFPAGTEIPDKWNGNSNPLIITQYVTSGNSQGVYCVRKYVEPASQTFGKSGSGTSYENSAIKAYLQGTYYDNCSDELKELILNTNINLMSASNVGGNGNYGYISQFWDYYKEKTGLTSLSDNANTGRLGATREGEIHTYWLRDYNGSTVAYYVKTNGQISSQPPTYTSGVLPACFIAKGDS